MEKKYKINIMGNDYYESYKIPSKQSIACESPEEESLEVKKQPKEESAEVKKKQVSLTKKYSNLTTKDNSILRSFLSNE